MYSKFTFPQHFQHPSSMTSFAILEFTVSHPHLWNVCIFASCPHRTLLRLPIWPFHYPRWFLSRSMCRLLGSWHSMFVFFSQVSIHDRESCLLVSGQQNHSVNACWTLCKKKIVILNKHFKEKQKRPVFRQCSLSVNISSLWHTNQQPESWQCSWLW